MEVRNSYATPHQRFLMNPGRVNIDVMHRLVSSLFVKLLKTTWHMVSMKVFKCFSVVSANH